MSPGNVTRVLVRPLRAEHEGEVVRARQAQALGGLIESRQARLVARYRLAEEGNLVVRAAKVVINLTFKQRIFKILEFGSTSF